jgi:hypothetical protein
MDVLNLGNGVSKWLKDECSSKVEAVQREVKSFPALMERCRGQLRDGL